MNKKLLCLVCLISLLLCSCRTAREEQQFLIGVNLALTGESAPFGTACLKGIQLALEEYEQLPGNHTKVELLVKDNASRSDLAGLISLQMEENPKVLGVVGPSLSHLVKAAAEQIEETVLLTPGATADQLTNDPTKPLFRLCFTDQVQGNYLATFAFQLGKRKAAILTDSASEYSKGLSKHFADSFSKQGGEVVAWLSYPPKEVDFYPLLSKGRASGADLLFLPAFYEQGGLLISQAEELGLKINIFSGDGFDSPALREICGNDQALKQVYFTNHNDPKEQTDFFFAYQKKFLEAPSSYSALAYDSAWTLLHAFNQTDANLLFSNPREFHLQLKTAIQKSDFEGSTGKISFDSKKNAIKEPVLLGFHLGQPVKINALQGGTS